MTITNTQLAVGVTSVSFGSLTARGSVQRVTMYNPGTTAIYVGGSSAVTITNGLAIAPGSYVIMDVGSGDQLYAIATIAAQTLHVVSQTP